MNQKITRRILDKKVIKVLIVLVLVLTAELFLYTWCRVQCVRVGYEMTVERQKHQELEVVHSNLRIEMARLESPERIAGIAGSQMDLAAPSPEQIIVMP